MSERLLSYADLAKMLKTTAEGARQQAQRRRWRRTKQNDGTVVVHVPEEDLARLSERRLDGRSAEARAAKVSAVPADDSRTSELFDRALNELRQQLDITRKDAARAHELEVGLVRTEGELRLAQEQRDRLEREVARIAEAATAAQSERDAERARVDNLVAELRQVNEKLAEATRPRSFWRRLVG